MDAMFLGPFSMKPYYIVNEQAKADCLREIKSMEPSKRLCVLIGEKTETRTSKQNRYYHGVALKHIEEVSFDAGKGFLSEHWHEYFKLKFLSSTFEVIFDEVVRIEPSTAKLSKKEFKEYMEKINLWCIEHLKTTIPLPESYGL